MEKKKVYKNEAQLQQDMVIWFKNNHLPLKRRLWATMNEGKNVTEKLGLGMTPGVPDLLYYGENERLYGFEVKLPGTKHGVKHLLTQAQWMLDVLPGRAWFVDSLETFQLAIEGNINEANLIDPQRVKDYCEACIKESLVWDRSLFV